jgi:hypothetical protein
MTKANKKSTGDGVALQSAMHPVAPWWRRVLFLFQRVRLSKDALENVEIDPDRVSKTGFKIGGPKP